MTALIVNESLILNRSIKIVWGLEILKISILPVTAVKPEIENKER